MKRRETYEPRWRTVDDVLVLVIGLEVFAAVWISVINWWPLW